MRCPACEGDNPDGKRFCQHCGRSLTAACAACGAQLGPLSQFCGDCGTPVGTGGIPDSSPTAPPPASTRVPGLSQALRPVTSPATGPATGSPTELHHVSVLFCDLVGFTPFSEGRTLKR
ncbi:MAG: double zinc ribbon domain-containing protein [Acidimicrobiales bacterium]